MNYDVWLDERYGLGRRPRFCSRKAAFECLSVVGNQPGFAEAFNRAQLDSDNACDAFAVRFNLEWENDSGGGRYIPSSDNLVWRKDREEAQRQRREHAFAMGWDAPHPIDDDYAEWTDLSELLTDDEDEPACAQCGSTLDTLCYGYDLCSRCVYANDVAFAQKFEPAESFCYPLDEGGDEYPERCSSCGSLLDESGSCTSRSYEYGTCAYRVAEQRRQAPRRVERLCRICGKEPGRAPYWRCDNCRDYLREHGRERSEFLAERDERERTQGLPDPAEPRWGDPRVPLPASLVRVADDVDPDGVGLLDSLDFSADYDDDE